MQKLVLVDQAPALVATWKRAFQAHPEVEVVNGDILSIARVAVVSPANSYGYMDGGIDRLYVDFFGQQLQRTVTEAISRQPEGTLLVGAALLVPTGHERIPLLVVAPTMMLPGPTTAAHVFFAMSAILQLADRHRDRLTELYCPGLGTGIGRVPFEDAAAEMAAAYGRWIERPGRSRPPRPTG